MLQALPPPTVLTTGCNQRFMPANSAASVASNYAAPLHVGNKCKTSCKRFCPNVFTPSKCQDCFRQKNAHSQEALAESRACRKVCKCGHLFVAPADTDFTDPSHRTRRWQRRWFVLYDDGDLTFSLDEQSDTIPQDVVDMDTVQEVSDAQKITGQDYSIVLKTATHEYYLRGTSKEEIRWWYDVLVMYPRSASYTKQQRSHAQKLRSRTLPSNGLSDEQLLALKISSAPATDILTSSTTAPINGATTTTENGHYKAPPSAGDAKPASSNRVKDTANSSATHGPSGGAPPHGNNSQPAPTSNRQHLEAAEHELAAASVKAPKKEQHVMANCVRSSTMDYLDQLKEKRMTSKPAVSNRSHDKAHRPDTIDVKPAAGTQAFGLTSDTASDSDLSSDADEGSVEHQSVPGPSLTPSSTTDCQKSQRFVFTGLSPKDIEDLKQLQRIMSKKSSPGSTSSRSSSSSISASVGLAPVTRHQSMVSLPKSQVFSLTAPLPVAKGPATTTEVDFHTRPRSPPLNRTAISRVKERARVRSRSKSPVRERSATVPPKGQDQQRTLVIDGDIKYEENVDESKPGNISTAPPGNKTMEIEGRLQSLRREYLTDMQRNQQQRHSDPSLPANFQLNLLLKPQQVPTKTYADQSTQISLDVRHYETMVSNLEKRLIDREQQLRDANHKITAHLERDRQNSLLEKRLTQAQSDLEQINHNLEKSQALNEDYQKRLQDFASLWATTKQDKLTRKDLEEHDRRRIAELEKELRDIEQSYDEMAASKDSVISSSRRETDKLSRKLNETESQLRHTTVELEKNLAVQERFEQTTSELTGLKTKCLRYEDDIVALKSQLAKAQEELAKTVKTHEEKRHEACHATIDGLHTEISSLQARLQSQERKHAAVLAVYQQRARRLTDSLSSLPEFLDSSVGGAGDSRALCQKSLQAMEASHAQFVEELRRQHQQEMEALARRKDQELADEAKATKAALEIIHRDYQAKLKVQVFKVMEEAKRMRDQGQQKMFGDVRKDIQDLITQFSSTATGSSEQHVSLRDKEKLLRSCQEQLMDLTRQYTDDLQPLDEKVVHASGVFVRPRKTPEPPVATPVEVSQSVEQDESSSETASSSSDSN